MSAPAATHGAMPGIFVGGTEVPERIRSAIRSVVVESDAHAADSCRIVLDDPGRDLLGAGGLDLGATITLTAARTGEPVGEPLFEGKVYGLGFEYDERGACSVVTAFDHSYRLYTGLHTVTYQNKTDGDIARQIAGEAQLEVGTIADTPVVHEHVSQFNETHWDFLTRRARETGYLVRVLGKKLDYLRSTAAEQAPAPGGFRSSDRLQLVPGGNLETLSARVTAAQQVGEVEVRGWDERNKRELVARSAAETPSARLRDTPVALAQHNRSPRHVTTSKPLATQAEVDATARAESERIAGTFAHVEGTAQGDPRLVAGTAVSLGSTGRLDGQLTLSRSRHVWNTKGYRTHFFVDGRQDRSVAGLVSGAAQARAGGAERVPGVVIGVVTNLDDPEKRGRVQVRFPWLSEDYQSDWARVAQLGAGNERGLLMLPQVDDEVLCAFEQGDTRRPVVLGGLHNGVDAIPFADAVGERGTVRRRGFRTPTGQRLVFTDEEQGERTIEIATKDDTVRITLDAQAKTLKIEAQKDVEVASSSGKVTIRAANDLELLAQGNAKVSGARGLTLESSATVTVSGSMIRLG